MPYDEVVLFNPRGTGVAWGYAQIILDRDSSRQNVYIALPKSTIEHVVWVRHGLLLDSVGRERGNLPNEACRQQGGE